MANELDDADLGEMYIVARAARELGFARIAIMPSSVEAMVLEIQQHRREGAQRVAAEKRLAMAVAFVDGDARVYECTDDDGDALGFWRVGIRDRDEALTATGGLEIVQDDELEDAAHPTALPSVDAAFAALAAYRIALPAVEPARGSDGDR